ncbi:MAG: phosphopentomutase, partial [Deltaproteobacteria bacterium]|nr:phosphopentomutase [Deltaproteobacteria bacterium]
PAAGGDTLIFITADHGCDPTLKHSTDHTREYVPLIVRHSGIGCGKDLGTRKTFADVGQTIAKNFGLPALPNGTAIFRDF